MSKADKIKNLVKALEGKEISDEKFISLVVSEAVAEIDELSKLLTDIDLRLDKINVEQQDNILSSLKTIKNELEKISVETFDLSKVEKLLDDLVNKKAPEMPKEFSINNLGNVVSLLKQIANKNNEVIIKEPNWIEKLNPAKAIKDLKDTFIRQLAEGIQKVNVENDFLNVKVFNSRDQQIDVFGGNVQRLGGRVTNKVIITDKNNSELILRPEGQLPVDDLFFAISKGQVAGHSVMEKFGEISEITTATDPADVWDGGNISGAHIYTFSTTADIDSLSSSDNTDTQDIQIEGLDENWEIVVQTVTLTGQTPVNLDTNLIRVYRMINRGTADLAGNVYCFVSGNTVTDGVPQTSTDIRAMIRNGNNQTLMCIYTVPAGKTGYFYGGYVTISRGPSAAAFADFTWRARLYGEVFAIKSRLSCISSGRSSWDYTYKIPVVLPEKTDVLIRCEQVSATLGASGGFTVLLVDN